jgi:hypothetical protein
MTGIKLSEKYKKEREEICNKIIELVGTEFLLANLDDNQELQQKIRDLKPDIQKYYAVSSLAVFRSNFPVVKRDYLNLIRFVIRQHGYKFINQEHIINGENGFIKRTVKYNIYNSESNI